MGKLQQGKLIIVLAALIPLCSGGGKNSTEKYEAKEISNKSQVGILRLRGFKAEVHYAITRDGYHLNLIRIVNPLIPPNSELKRPVLFNHGLLESSTIWLVNSRDVRPKAKEDFCWSLPIDDRVVENNTDEFRNLPMLLAINGYDVWLLSMRGTDWSLYHEIMDRSLPEYWDYSLDQFAQDDVPSAIQYIRLQTKAPKVGYIGHSQATFSVFGMLAHLPHFAKYVEPVFAVAPVAYFSNITSILRPSFLALLAAPQKQGPLPESAKFMRQTLTRICAKEDDRQATLKPACNLVEELVGGMGLDAPSGYYSHIPFFTSYKVMRHFGQLISSKKFAMYDHGKEGNQIRYAKDDAPLYQVGKIKSRSLVLIWTKTDSLSAPKDVEQFISELKVPLYRNIFIDGRFNHFDLLLNEQASHLVNKPVLEILEEFEQRNGVCRAPSIEQPALSPRLPPRLPPLSPISPLPPMSGPFRKPDHRRKGTSKKHQGNSIDFKPNFAF